MIDQHFTAAGRQQPPPPPGLLIVFEGGEGAGKTTQLNLLADRLQAALPDREVVTTAEPAGTPLGRRIRELLLAPDGTPIDPVSELMLFLAARADHIQTVIRPALDRGAIVLCDRFVDSTVVYQGHARGMGANRVREVSDWVTGRTIPDLVVVLDIDPEVGLARVAGRGTPDRMEQADRQFHKRVRVGFLACVASARDHERDQMIAPYQAGKMIRTTTGPRYVLLAADAPTDTIADAVWDHTAHILHLPTGATR